MKILFTLLLLLSSAFNTFATADDYDVRSVVTGLNHPWSMAFLPNGDVLVSERSGKLRLIQNGQLITQPVSGLPAITSVGQGGLLGLALHPQFSKNRWLYFAYTGSDQHGHSTHVARGQYQNGALSDVHVIFAATPKVRSGVHFGARLAFDKAGQLYITLGDRGKRRFAQQPSNHAGSLIRLNDDGSLPQDNPFYKQENVAKGLYSYGHRNQQGIAIDPRTQQLWTHEHGPRGGDELNLIKRGANYGWPVITYGEEYSGGEVGNGLTQKPGLQQPVHYWVPSIAPSGMTFYHHTRFPSWNNKLFIGSLKFQLIAQLEMNNNKVVKETRILKGVLGRIRDIKQGPEGYLYILNDRPSPNGGLFRLGLK